MVSRAEARCQALSVAVVIFGQVIVAAVPVATVAVASIGVVLSTPM
jgi:hypothetical protein